nr:unnamed protein product [Callosobruchus chinensis]CAH7753028.1 unnamed protein product [Callosobruchus chinensis]
MKTFHWQKIRFQERNARSKVSKVYIQ